MFKTTQEVPTGFNLTWNAVSGLVYQVQYTTNLLQPNWLNLGPSMTANNSTLTVSDTNGPSSSPQRFYRVLLIP